MLKALTILNLFLGSCSLALYARYAGASALTSPSKDSIMLLGVGVAGLGAAGMGLKRISILLHGMAMTAFMAFAFGGEPVGETSVALKNLLSRLLSKEGLLPGVGIFLSTLGALMDVRALKHRRSRQESAPVETSPSIAASPSPVQATTKPRPALPKPAPASPNTKVVRCQCGKPLRVSLKAKSARCPSCQGVLKLS